MASVRFDGQSYQLQEGESVLDGLLRHGLNRSYSCKAGACRSCLVKAKSGTVPARAQSGLKDSWKARGYLLSCVCVPEEDLELEAADADLRYDAVISSLRPLSSDVLEVRFHCDTPIDFRAGQYVTVFRADGLARSYSIASCPEDGDIQLHVRKVPQGQMSGWFHTEARVGDRASLQGPSGECFYVEGRESQPLLLAGTGTGLAPLYGIVRDALARGHSGPIHLFHGALQRGGLYLVEELRELARRYPQLQYTPAVLRGDEDKDVAIGALDQVISQYIPNTAGWRGFVCGDPNLVQTIRKRLFLAGMASRDIYADAFIPTAIPNTCN